MSATPTDKKEYVIVSINEQIKASLDKGDVVEAKGIGNEYDQMKLLVP